MIPLPGGSSPFLFLPSKLRHPASQPVHSPPPTTPPAVVQTGCRPNRVSSKPGTHHRVRLARRREDAKRTQWSSARGQIGRRRAGVGDRPLGDRNNTCDKPTQERRAERGRSGGHTTSATGSGDTGSGDTPHSNRGIPHHSAEAYHSTGIYRSTGTYRSTGIRPNRGHTTAFVSREDAKTRRAGDGDTPLGDRNNTCDKHTQERRPERGTHHFSDGDGRSRGHTTPFVSREDAKGNAVVFGTGDKSAGDSPE